MGISAHLEEPNPLGEGLVVRERPLPPQLVQAVHKVAAAADDGGPGGGDVLRLANEIFLEKTMAPFVGKTAPGAKKILRKFALLECIVGKKLIHLARHICESPSSRTK